MEFREEEKMSKLNFSVDGFKSRLDIAEWKDRTQYP